MNKTVIWKCHITDNNKVKITKWFRWNLTVYSLLIKMEEFIHRTFYNLITNHDICKRCIQRKALYCNKLSQLLFYQHCFSRCLIYSYISDILTHRTLKPAQGLTCADQLYYFSQLVLLWRSPAMKLRSSSLPIPTMPSLTCSVRSTWTGPTLILCGSGWKTSPTEKASWESKWDKGMGWHSYFSWHKGLSEPIMTGILIL